MPRYFVTLLLGFLTFLELPLRNTAAPITHPAISLIPDILSTPLIHRFEISRMFRRLGRFFLHQDHSKDHGGACRVRPKELADSQFQFHNVGSDRPHIDCDGPSIVCAISTDIDHVMVGCHRLSGQADEELARTKLIRIPRIRPKWKPLERSRLPTSVRMPRTITWDCGEGYYAKAVQCVKKWCGELEITCVYFGKAVVNHSGSEGTLSVLGD